MKIKIKKAIEYFDGYGSPYDDLVIKALEKQIPKKPYDTSKTYTGDRIGVCSNCKHYTVVLEQERYCNHCGQRLDWE